MRRQPFLLLSLLYILIPVLTVRAQLQPVHSFGSNPGNINIYKHVPAAMPAHAPLVVVLHGCTQNATLFSTQTGWNTLADKHKFYVLYAEQKAANNATNCFNYWEPGDFSRGQGEVLSVKQAVDYMLSSYSIDSARVFVTGLSAGGAMTVNMLSAYPDVFAAGAEMAGVPYRAAESFSEVALVAPGLVSKSPQQWGDLVRSQYPGFSGTYPRLAIFHGTADIIINYRNSDELIKQFTNLHNTDQQADSVVNNFNGNAQVRYEEFWDAEGTPVVVRYTFQNMAHGIAVDPGSCYTQGGVSGTNSLDVDFYSSFWAAHFFGILQPPIIISGDDTVTAFQQNVVYEVPSHPGSSYLWEVPPGVTLVSGQGSASVIIHWGNQSGSISVTETTSDGCTWGPAFLSVTVLPDSVPLSRRHITDPQPQVWITRHGGHAVIIIRSQTTYRSEIEVYTIDGKSVARTSLSPNQTQRIAVDASPAIYFIKCSTPSGVSAGKIVF
ncbi:MAG: hypothetical protein KatS3mg031_0309 [Chitinophagales bacterium]|nr:MAG: hypothetical protein KatS3mg031_0309 [Chitinophagales bacterium]